MTDVKRLLEEATPLPWATTSDANLYECRFTGDGTPILGGYLAAFEEASDAVLAVYAVTHLLAYEAAAEALEALADAATALESRSIRSGGEFHVWAEERMVTEARDAAREALRRLRDEVPA